MRGSVTDLVVVITGASAGIGLEAARLFAREGACVVAAARRMDRLQSLVAEIEAGGGTAMAVRTDVSIPEEVERLAASAVERFGHVDVWVNNAGYGLIGSVEQTTVEEMQRLMDTNFMGMFHGCKAAIAQMRKQGRGHIINVSSLAARFPMPLHAGYTATKCAMDGFTEALAIEMSGTGIEVSVILPGVTETDFSTAAVNKIPDVPGHSYGPEATAADVAAQILRCVKRPRPVVALAPLPRLVLAIHDLFPSIWRAAGRKYVRIRTGGRGIGSGSE